MALSITAESLISVDRVAGCYYRFLHAATHSEKWLKRSYKPNAVSTNSGLSQSATKWNGPVPLLTGLAMGHERSIQKRCADISAGAFDKVYLIVCGEATSSRTIKCQ